MFKPILMAAAALTMTAAPLAASAQSWHDRDRDRYDRDRYDRDRHDRWDRDDRWGRDRYDRDRYDRYDRRGPPYGNAYGYHRRWQRGSVIPYDSRSRWYISDYRRYGYAPPPRGYGYYRTDSGEVVMALIATGVILSLLD